MYNNKGKRINEDKKHTSINNIVINIYLCYKQITGSPRISFVRTKKTVSRIFKFRSDWDLLKIENIYS